MNGVQGIIVAGLSGGSGKSVVSVALTAYLKDAGLEVVPFKKGPDYIDAGWLSLAAGRPCYNLDPYLMEPDVLTDSFASHAAGADCTVIEGNRGLYDGVDVDGGFSTAALAIQLDMPILLVVNCTKVTRTVAAMVLGCMQLDSRVNICGVLLNQVATSRQESVIRQSVEKYTGLPVVGVVPRQKRDIFPMRHLGVTPHQETEASTAAIGQLSRLAATNFDTGSIRKLMHHVSLPAPGNTPWQEPDQVIIGVVRDRAFQFYYEENLESLRNAGAKLVMIDALQADSLPPGLHTLYIGGGFPETSARELSANILFRESVRLAARSGLPIYAECGGLIFLGRSIVIDGEEFPLAGVFPVTFGMSRRPQAHGYSTFRIEQDTPFYDAGTVVRGHEFRYSTILQWDGSDSDLAAAMERGTGFVNGRDGLVCENVFALYTHILAPGTPQWASGMISAARAFRSRLEGV